MTLFIGLDGHTHTLYHIDKKNGLIFGRQPFLFIFYIEKNIDLRKTRLNYERNN